MNSFLNLVSVLESSAKGNKGITFIESDGKEEFLSYQDLFIKSKTILHSLQKKGLHPGDELVFQLEQNKDFICLFWACLMGRIIPVPITLAVNPESRLKLFNVWKVLNNPYLACNANYLEKLSEKTNSDHDLLEQMQKKSLQIEQMYAGSIEGILQNPKADDIAFIQFSSGSTGDPKGVILTHENLLANINAIITCSGLSEKDSTIGWMPLTHDMGLIGFHLTPLLRNIYQFIMPTTLFIRRPELWIQKTSDNKITFLASPNFGYKHLLSYYKPDQAKDWDLSHVRIILNGAEPISVDLCDEFMQEMAQYGLKRQAMFPVYGMAEASLAVTFPPIGEDYRAIYLNRNHLNLGETIQETLTNKDNSTVSFVDVGLPVLDCEVRIMDWEHKPIAENVIGYIQIKGKNVTQGYYNNEKATTALITKDGWLNTGDLGFMRDGRLVITGRAKDIIFFNGQNYYPHDIERVAEEVDGIGLGKIVACGVDDKILQRDEILLFVLHKGKVSDFVDTAIQLKAFISQKITLELSHIIPINSLPKTTSGKIQRYKLAESYKNGEFEAVINELTQLVKEKFISKEHIAPRNEAEIKLVNIWEEILKIQGIGINDNFFELGGHSLKATLLVAQIQKAFNIEFTLREIFKAPTIEQLARSIQSKEGLEFEAIEIISQRNFYPVSSAQKRLFILHQLSEANTAYNISNIMAVEGELDHLKMEHAFQKLIDRHEILRTSFEESNGIPVQKVHAKVDFHIESLECQSEDLTSVYLKFFRSFDLTKAPLIRVGIVKASHNNFLLLTDMHHIITDGTSMGILIEEVSAIYQDLEVNPVKTNYKDYTIWQQSFLQKEKSIEQKNYWLGQFRDELPVLNLPTDFSRPAVQNFEGSTLKFQFGKDLTSKLNKLAYDNGSTLYMVLMASYNVLLSKYSGQDDIIVGTPVSGRSHVDLITMPGVFINTLAMRNFPKPNKTFKDFLSEVKDNTINSLIHQDYPFEELTEKLNINRDLSRNALFDTLFAVQNIGLNDLKIHQLKFSQVDFPSRTSQLDLSIYANEHKGEINFQAEYSTKLFNLSTIERLAEHFYNIAAQVIHTPNIAIQDISLTSEKERNTILKGFNNSSFEINIENTIVDLFEKRVAETPNSVAVVFENKSLTYNGLNEKVNSLAFTLRKNGAQQNQIVGIMIERSLDMLIGILGIIKSGAAYLPIDPEYPNDRINYMLSDSETLILLSRKELRSKVDFGGTFIDFNEAIEQEEKNISLEKINSSSDLAYVIYTSGSTGKPKGVMLEHRNVVAFTANIKNTFGLNTTDTILGLTTITFDISVLELICALVEGVKIVIASDKTIAEPKELVRLMVDEKVSVLQITPSRLQLLLESCGEKALNGIRKLLVGGEAMPIPLFDLLKHKNSIDAYNVYGPTEATIWSSAAKISNEALSIGKPLCNESIYIISENQQLQPIGIPGELCIGGTGLGRGYWKQAELTAEKFILNPFDQGEKMYRTGDLAKWLPDGNIEYLGRIDQQVKIRGYRIELGEIENQLRNHSSIKEVVVIDRKDHNGISILCAYFISDHEINSDELRSFLSQTLPEYMIPSYFVAIEKIPLTPNGKVNRKALPEPNTKLTSNNKYVAPVDATEIKLANIWNEILGIEKSGTKDNFFSLGGHSLKASMLVSKIQKIFGVEIKLREVFESPTIYHLAKRIQSSKNIAYESITPIASQEFYLASSSQKRMYVLSQFEGSETSYNMPGIYSIDGNLDFQKLERTFQMLLERHETLRTSFEMCDGETVQMIHPEIDFKINKLSSAEFSLSTIVQPFDLSKGPLIRASLINENENKHLLFVDMHHIISDGVSVGILMREFADLYNGITLEPLKIQYKDFAAWQNTFLTSEALQTQKEFWIKQFSDEIPVLELPTDFNRPSIQSFEGATIHFTLENEIILKLKDISSETGTTMYMVLFAAYNILLSKYSGQNDIVIGTPVAGRPHADLQQLIGMFVNTLALRNYPKANKTFRSFLLEVKENLLNSFENQDFPFEELVESLDVKRDMSRNPLFDTMFSYQNININNFSVDGLELRSVETENKISKFDITLDVIENSDKLDLNFEYCTSLFKKESIERIIRHFKNIIVEILDQPDISLSNIEMLTESEKHQVLSIFNNTKVDYPKDKTFITLFEEQVSKSSESISLIFENETMSYRELNEKANQIARLLISKGIGSDSIVGIMVEPSFEMMIGLLAILKSGAAYLPIDINYPAERISFMIEDSSVKYLLIKGNLNEAFSRVENIDLLDQSNYSGDLSNPNTDIRQEHLAYITYTSGSTGKPKGVMIEHKNLFDYLNTFINLVGVTSNDTTLQNSSISFDTAIEELFPTLCVSGKVLINKNNKDFNKLIEYISNEQITILSTSPLVLNYINEEAKDLGKLRAVISGGDVLKPSHISNLVNKLTIYNSYGPTESTVCITYHQVKNIDKNIPIGKAIANRQVYILDTNLNLLPVGIVGELCVGGKGIARGYLNREDLTNEKFVANPFIENEKIYKTGDLAKWLPDGSIEFIGRIDDQVKIRGFRIELGEIESKIIHIPGITQTTVIDLEDSKGTKFLCAYYVAEKTIDTSTIREFLSTELPDYMIPSFFVQIEEIPMTINGKINKKALPTPEFSTESGNTIAPRNETESILVQIFEEVLGIKDIGINHNFFELGGDSIKAIQISSRLQKHNLKLSVGNLFTNPTIEKLAPFIKEGTQKALQTAIEGTVELTPIQQAFFEAQYEYPNHYNQSVMLYNKSGIDETALKTALSKLAEHHDALRMEYRIVYDFVIQHNNEPNNRPFDLNIFDFSNSESPEESIINEANKIQRSIDFDSGPLMKIGLFKTNNGDHLLIVIHHLIVDGVSWRILLEDFNTAYYQALKSEEINLPEKTDSFQTWAEKLTEYASSESLLNEIEYWKNIQTQTVGLLATQSSQSKGSKTLQFNLSKEETKTLLTEVNKTFEAEINDVLISALGYAIKDWTQHDNILINLEGHGREEIISDVDINRTVGWFTSEFPVLINMKDCSLSEQIKTTKETLRKIPNKGIGYGILKYLTPSELKGDFSFNMSPEISFNYLGQFEDAAIDSGFGVSTISTSDNKEPNDKKVFLIDINGIITNGELKFDFEFDHGILNEDLIHDFTLKYKDHLQNIIKHCAVKSDTENKVDTFA